MCFFAEKWAKATNSKTHRITAGEFRKLPKRQ
jgi:hypothetical protein